jgi:DNA-binding HxlR family transcriptional regulator
MNIIVEKRLKILEREGSLERTRQKEMKPKVSKHPLTQPGREKM